MLTLFTVAKPFCSDFAVIQRNAIASWARLRPACQTLLLGNEVGLAEVAAETGATHLPELDRNEFGTPLVSNVFAQAEKHASFPRLCYVNADIILLSDFLPAIQRIIAWNPQSLVIGRRWDLDLAEPVKWESEWELSLHSQLQNAGKLHSSSGLDFFVFPRGLWGALPHLAVGRTLWDGWLVYRARALGVPVVDATECLTAVHQNHSYAHHPDGEVGVWQGVEAQRNSSIGGGLRHAYSLRDATHRLTPAAVRRRLIPIDLRRSLVFPIVSHKWARPLVRLKKALVEELRSAAPESTR